MLFFRAVSGGLAFFALVLVALSLAPHVRVSASAAYFQQDIDGVPDGVQRHTFVSIIDHFGYRPLHPNTFPLRYFVYDKYWKGASSPYNARNKSTRTIAPETAAAAQGQPGPCFFYAGNEADILLFLNNSGFIFEAAREFNALVVFAEHRYYGESFPFGSALSALTPQNITYLTVEQAMADFNMLNIHIRKKWSVPQIPFVAFGGSYGANLALWLRLKSPHLWAGAIASSATPLKHLLRETNSFNRIVAEVYGNVSSACPDLIRAGWASLFDRARTQAGREHIAHELNLCKPLPNANAADYIYGFVSGALETMVQYGYPYATSFYNPVPAYPFKVACEAMLRAGTGLGALRAAAGIYYNYTGQAGSCFDFEGYVIHMASNHWRRTRRVSRFEDATDLAWSYQTCTEVYQPMPTDGKTDFELPYSPNETAYFEKCMERWGVYPRPDWEEQTFGGSDIGAGSNIFLTSGQLDPWRAAGIQSKPLGAPQSIVVRIIDDGAHHLDLRGSNPSDPLSVIDVRNAEKTAIRKWVDEWKNTHPDGRYRGQGDSRVGNTTQHSTPAHNKMSLRAH